MDYREVRYIIINAPDKISDRAIQNKGLIESFDTTGLLFITSFTLIYSLFSNCSVLLELENEVILSLFSLLRIFAIFLTAAFGSSLGLNVNSKPSGIQGAWSSKETHITL